MRRSIPAGEPLGVNAVKCLVFHAIFTTSNYLHHQEYPQLLTPYSDTQGKFCVAQFPRLLFLYINLYIAKFFNYLLTALLQKSTKHAELRVNLFRNVEFSWVIISAKKSFRENKLNKVLTRKFT